MSSSAHCTEYCRCLTARQFSGLIGDLAELSASVRVCLETNPLTLFNHDAMFIGVLELHECKVRHEYSPRDATAAIQLFW